MKDRYKHPDYTKQARGKKFIKKSLYIHRDYKTKKFLYGYEFKYLNKEIL